MELKETNIRTREADSVVDNSDYYKFIFKKTEKIACAVFYVMRSSQHIRQDDAVVIDLESVSQRLLNVSLESLAYTSHDVFEKALEIKCALIACEAKLRIANAAHLLSTDLLEVFIHEIDSVQRSLRKYTESSVSNPLTRETYKEDHVVQKRQYRAREIASLGTPKRVGDVPVVDRRTSVLNIIRDKGEATIKDIMEVVVDCSEKTIQRELISLIKDNVIVREGERRWSKYKLI